MKEIDLKNQEFGGHKQAISLELQFPIRIDKAINMKLKSFNTGSENYRFEKMVRKIKVDKFQPNNKNLVRLYIDKEKTKLYFVVKKSDLDMI